MVQGKFFGSPHLVAPVLTKMCGTFFAFTYLCMAVLVGVPSVPASSSTRSSSTSLRTCSTVRGGDFSRMYGVALADGPLKGLNARAVVVLDARNKVLHSQLVPEIKNEPDYDAALAALK